MRVIRPVKRIEYPLVKIIFLADVIEREIGIKPLSVVAHHKKGITILQFERELTEEERTKLDTLMRGLYESPPSYYSYTFAADPEEVKADVEATVGVRPLSLTLDGGRIFSVVFERELTPTELGLLKPLFEKDYRKALMRKL